MRVTDLTYENVSQVSIVSWNLKEAGGKHLT